MGISLHNFPDQRLQDIPQCSHDFPSAQVSTGRAQFSNRRETLLSSPQYYSVPGKFYSTLAILPDVCPAGCTAKVYNGLAPGKRCGEGDKTALLWMFENNTCYESDYILLQWERKLIATSYITMREVQGWVTKIGNI